MVMKERENKVEFDCQHHHKIFRCTVGPYTYYELVKCGRRTKITLQCPITVSPYRPLDENMHHYHE